MTWEAGHRTRDPRPAEDADEDVLPLRERVGRGAEHADVPGLPRPSRRASGAEPQGDRVDGQARPRARLRDRPARRLRTGRTTSIPTSRRATRSPSTSEPALRRRTLRRARPGGRPRDRHRPRAPRGGRREDDPRRRRGRPDPRAPRRRSSTSTGAGRRWSRSSSEPDFRSAEEAKRFLQLLRQTVVELGISDAEMEKGSLRCDANVSVREAGEAGYRTKTELKNMNSFTFVAEGIEAELERQIGIYEAGGEVVQETLHFDPQSGSISPLRSKEEADDYRYFPEPDLVPVEPPRRAGGRAARRAARAPRRADQAARAARPGFELAEGLVTSGRDRLFERVPRDDRRAVANVIMNQLAGAGVDPGRGRSRRAGEARRGPRPRSRARHSTRRSRRAGEPGFSADPYLAEEAVSDALRARPGDRRDPGRQPGPGRAVPRRQGGPARLLRRPGDEGDRTARRTRRSSASACARS